MKTIDERIQEKGFWYDSNDNCCVDYTSVVELIEEQKKIDIDKACEWLKNHVGSAYIDMGKVGLSECHCQDWWLEEFCKAMEEDV